MECNHYDYAVDEAVRNMEAKRILLSGVPEGFDATVLMNEAASGGVIHIARDANRMQAIESALSFFAPDIPVFKFPAWDCLPYDRVSPNAEVSANRVANLTKFATGMPNRFVVLTTLAGASQRVPTRKTLRETTFRASLKTSVDEKKLRNFLMRMGFVNTSTVMEAGDYAIRGGIIDIFPSGNAEPIRLDFFGNTLDGIRTFDPVTQRTTGSLTEIELSPVCEVILDDVSIKRFRQNYRFEFGAAGADDPLYEAVSEGRKYQGLEHWLPFFYEELETFFDYLPKSTIVLDDQFDVACVARWDTINDQYEARYDALDQTTSLDTIYKPIAVELLYFNEKLWKKVLSSRRVVALSVLPQPTGLNSIDAGGRIGHDFAEERQRKDISLFKALSDYLNKKIIKKQVIITSYSSGSNERLAGLLEDEGHLGINEIDNITGLNGNGLYLTVLPLEHGFETDDLLVISEQDILGDRLVRPQRQRRRAENFLTESQSLNPGDLVVHVDHGVGRFQGLEIISIAGASHECLSLEYAESSKLYLPVENIELLTRYGHEDGFLDRLGGGAWQAKKAKLKDRIREMAEKLIRVAAERALRRAPILEPPAEMWDSFCARFPYQETDDQLNAISDVINDLSAGVPMDRLICGDVGFGKTEVAMRAAFIAALSGLQVAVIAPTTLLARQHAKSFMERFRGFPIEIKQLSRFVNTKDANFTRRGLSSGAVDIVIGTHAVLAQQVRFKNLGLLVVDEEQRFGVGHKERLKQMRSDIHVLTLTATPIPRTLQLSLTGVRNLSIIGTPPIDRLAIRTYVSEFDKITIREALLREHYRGGQSFFVVPRIKDIPEIESFLSEDVPEVSFVVAHGQMPARELDDKMNAFYDGKFDVLLATTIVESGLDIPSANTMIIHRADMFGMAQLYQIRGRVGRSKTRAYAFLTTKPKGKLTTTAEKRLRVLGSLDSLGAGFTLASQDLDIRGAGNLLGDEQSGQIRDVGYELYQKMLEDAVAGIKSGATEVNLGNDQWAPQINLGVSVLIPEAYVPDLDVRLGLYRRLSSLDTKVELEGFAAELIDRFGDLPKEINTLLLIVRIKTMCHKAGISKLDGGPRGATIQFHNEKFESPGGLVAFLEDQRGLAKIKDNKLVIRRDWRRTSDKIKGAFTVAKELAALVAKEIKQNR